MTYLEFLQSIRSSSGIQAILRNTIALTIANIGVKVLSLVYIVVLARQAGVYGVGAYSLATAIGGYIFIVADWGLNNYVIQQASVKQQVAAQLFSSVLKLKLCFVVVTVPLIFIFSFIFGDNREQTALIVIISTGFVIKSFSQLNYAVFRSKERMGFEAIFTLFTLVIFVFLAYVMLEGFGFLYWVGIAFLIAQTVQLSIISITRKKLLFPSDLTIPVNWKLTISAFPFSITSIVSTAFTQIDILVIALIASVTLVGEYTLISRLLIATSAVPIIVGSSIWPRAARLFKSNQARFHRLTSYFVGLNIAVGFVVALILIAVSEAIITRLYGEQYLYLAKLLHIGAAFIVFKFISLSLGYSLTSANRQKHRAIAVLLGLVATVISVVVLVPSMGVAGAVWALVLSEIFLTVILGVFAYDLLVWKHIGFIFSFGLLASVISLLINNAFALIFSFPSQLVEGIVVTVLYLAFFFPVLMILYLKNKEPSLNKLLIC
jgi:O-antigen/teichoic acid export membrane protein